MAKTRDLCFLAAIGISFCFISYIWFIAILSITSCFISHVETNFAISSFIYGSHQSSILNKGDDLRLVLTKASGGGIKSYNQYLFGSFEVLIKLIPGNSAGTVTTFYLSSTGDRHDEIDFEFLGNETGQPYTFHTNIFVQGVGRKEKQFHLWFDPTTAYHNYTIHWNPSEIVWYVDNTPIRVFKNYQNQSIGYPNQQGMRVFATLWNADEWATQGGRIKTDWNRAPFVARFHGFKPSACIWKGPASISKCTEESPENWWTSPAYSQLNNSQTSKLIKVLNTYKVYDYCDDIKRFKGRLPAECSLPQF